MKFFEFNNYEYYALIIAESVENALLGYEEEVADIYEGEQELSPDEVTLEHSLSKYIKGDIEGCYSDEEKINDFHNNIDYYKDSIHNKNGKYLILLIDGGLI